jgi:predicted PurR-regulated permease PerM
MNVITANREFTADTSDHVLKRAMVSRGVRYILFAVGIIILVLMLWRIRDLVLVCFGGIIGAIILRGLADIIAHRCHISPCWALATTLAALAIIFGGLFWFFGNQIANEFGELQSLIPKAIAQLNTTLQGSSAGRAIIDLLKHATADSKMLSNMGVVAGSLFGALTDLSLIVFLSVYFAFSPEVYFEGFLSLITPQHRHRVRHALSDTVCVLKKWLVAQLYAMVIVGVLVGVSSTVLKIPLALVLGISAGFLEFIPVVGPIVFTIPAVLIASTHNLTSVFNVLIVYFAVQQLESNIITPLLQQRAVQVPPAVTLLALMVGGLLLGPMGVVFGIPMTVVLISLAKHLYSENGHHDLSIVSAERF